MLRAIAGLAFATILAACAGGTGALGYAEAPAALDPNSPKVAAKDMAFDQAEVDVPANGAFILVFENREGVGHNVSVYADATYQTRLFEGVVFSSSTRWYPVPSLAPGTYAFKCDVHPEMNGRLHAA
jgi:plastocyanin